MKMKVFAAVAAAVAFGGAAQARPVDLALWTFEVSIPTTPGPHSAEGGLFAGAGSPASTNSGGIISNPVGNASVESFSSDGWAIGEYYEFRTSSTGYDTITITWDQASSNTGPRDFRLQVSTNGGGSYSDLFDYAVLANATPNTPWSSGGTRNAAYTNSQSLGISAANLADLRVRLTVRSSVSANGGAVAGTGTDRVDWVQISGELVPTPGSLALLGLGGLVAARRRRN